MNSEFKSGKQFRAMVRRTALQTPVLAILAYLCFLFFTILSGFNYIYGGLHGTIETAYFWNDLRDYGFAGLANAAFIAAGVVNAMLAFNFCWSKKHSNVIFSLGVKKSDIYFAKLIGGLVPMAVAITLAGITETISCYADGGLIDGRYVALAVLTCLQFFAVYALSYTLSCAVMANTGNVVEGILFTAILSVFTMILSVFCDSMFWSFTHGAAIEPHPTTAIPEWNWAAPFLVFYDYQNNFITEYFSVNSLYSISFNHWSGIISAFAYSVIVTALGFLGFRKRRNEICGTWGRAKGLNEIVGAVSGFYAFYFIVCIALYPVHGDGSILTFIYGCIAFLAVYLIFKLVFGYKRKKELRAAFNRFPAYVMGLGAVCLVFTFGLFGYSSEVPEVSKVSTVTVSSVSYKCMDDALMSSSNYALKAMNERQSFIGNPIDPTFSAYESLATYAEFTPGIHFTTDADIQKVVDLHKKLVADGRIKNSGADSVGANIRIKYVLDDGTEIVRFYSEATEGAYEKLFALNSTEPVKETLKDYLKYDADVDFYRELLTADLFGYETDTSYYDSYFATEYHDTGIYHKNKAATIVMKECYLFPTDMSGGYNMGLIDQELFKAICDDMCIITPEQYFNHSSADEIGVLSFGLSNSRYIGPYDEEFIGDSYIIEEGIIVEDKIVLYPEEEEEVSTVGTTQTTSWNVNSRDIKAIVLTKDMKNTIAYLEKHDLMKYFEPKRDVSDIQSVKIATLGELYGEKNKSNNIPLFYGAYWTGAQMKEWIQEYETSVYGYYEYRFDDIHNDITDKAQIQKLLDSSVVFGFCSNKDKIMEITYSDGATATVLVKSN